MGATVTTIGFVGLGQMGKHMAKNLMGPGTDLTVSDVSEEQFASFRAAGAKATRNVQDLAECALIFLSLPNDSVVRAVVLGENGLLPKLSAGQIVVDLSTITYDATKEIAAKLAERGVRFMDAPVSGMEARARDATLSVMVGANPADLAVVEPFLKQIGNKVLLMGEVGSGQLTKLVNQLLFDINMAGLAEVLPFAAKMGLDPEKIGEIVNSGTGRSHASEFFIPRILDGNFKDGYPMQHAYKDLISGAMIAANENIPMPVLHASTVTYQMALLKGLGAEDKGAMIKVYEDLLNVTYRR